MNLPRRGPKCILPPCTVRQIDGEAKISPRISFGDLFKMFDFDVTSSPNWELDSTFMSTNYFEVMSNLRCARCHWNATGNPNNLATNTQGGFCIKGRMAIQKRTQFQLLSVVNDLWWCGAVLPPRPRESCYDTWHHGLHDSLANYLLIWLHPPRRYSYIFLLNLPRW